MIAEVIYYQAGIRDLAPEWVTQYVVNLFKRGALSTAMFMVVMYTGTPDGRRPVVRALMGAAPADKT